MGLQEIVILTLFGGVILFIVFLAVKSNVDKGKPYVRNILQGIADDKKTLSLVRVILKKGGLTEEKIIEMSGDRSMPLHILLLGSHNYHHISLNLAPLPPDLPAAITYKDKDGGKIKITPEWLSIIKKAELVDWDVKKIKLPRC